MIDINEELANTLLEKTDLRTTYKRKNETQKKALCKQLEVELREFINLKYPELLIDYNNIKRKLKNLLVDGTSFTLQTLDTSKFILILRL